MMESIDCRNPYVQESIEYPDGTHPFHWSPDPLHPQFPALGECAFVVVDRPEERERKENGRYWCGKGYHEHPCR